MAINYADSRDGWLCDERYFKRLQGKLASIEGRLYNTKSDGNVIFATVYISSIDQTGVVVLANIERLASYDQGSTKAQGAFMYKGFRWFISDFNYWQHGNLNDASGISQKVTVASADYTIVGKAILDSAKLCRDEDFVGSLERVYYNGKSKVIKRLCQLINNFNSRAMLREIYDTDGNGIVDNSEKVNGHNVYCDVPTDAVFTDTVYDDTQISLDVRTLQNQIQILIDEVFKSNFHYLIDADGYKILDSNGFPIITGSYESKIPQNLAERLADLEGRKYIYWADPQGETGSTS